MPYLGRKSREKLELVHPVLVELCEVVIEVFDFTVLSGHRNEEEQHRAYRDGMSKVDWPDSKHNPVPSLAVDLAPYFREKPHVRWGGRDLKYFYFLAGLFLMAAHDRGIKVRWGGDFNQDTDLDNDRFIDMPHFELIGV